MPPGALETERTWAGTLCHDPPPPLKSSGSRGRPAWRKGWSVGGPAPSSRRALRCCLKGSSSPGVWAVSDAQPVAGAAHDPPRLGWLNPGVRSQQHVRAGQRAPWAACQESPGSAARERAGFEMILDNQHSHGSTVVWGVGQQNLCRVAELLVADHHARERGQRRATLMLLAIFATGWPGAGQAGAGSHGGLLSCIAPRCHSLSRQDPPAARCRRRRPQVRADGLLTQCRTSTSACDAA